MSSGCTLCLKEAAKSHPPKAPQFMIFLLSILGMAVVLYQIFGPGSGEGGDLGAGATQVASAAAGTGKLDPEPYRQAIEALETVLFSPLEDAQDIADAGAGLGATFGNLSAEIRRRETEPESADAIARLAAPAGTPAAETAFPLASAEASVAETPAVEAPVDDPQDRRFSFGELERSRRTWLRLRGLYFLPASWLTEPAEDGSAKARILIAEHQEVARGLMALLREGATEAQAFSDSAEEADEVGFQEDLGDWRQRIDELWKSKPKRPGTAADPQILVAVQELETAFQRTWALAGSVALGDPASRFDDVLALAEKAQRSFDDVRL